jgi:hypothetical protein
VYPYSIVPGGVSGAAELARVIRKDRVVAEHYAGFDVDRAQKRTVTTPRAVHVSYRKGDKVYWTAKKLMLAQGETLLADGSHEVRARCANRISDTPQLPVEAHEPSAEELDSSVPGDGLAQEGLENVSMGMPEDDGSGRPGGFLSAPGTLGAASVGGGAASTPMSSMFLAGGQPLLSPVSRGGMLGAGSSGSTGTRPAPGTTSPDDATGSPAQSTPASSAGPAASAPGMAESPASASPPQSTPFLPAQPDGALPSTPTGPVAAPAAELPLATPGLGLPGALPAPAAGVDAAPLPAGLSGGGDNSIVDPIATVPGTGGPGDSPIPAPTLSPPILPALPVKDAATPADIPEPGTLWLCGALLAGLLARRRAPRRAR